jgi:hypothetical protein
MAHLLIGTTNDRRSDPKEHDRRSGFATGRAWPGLGRWRGAAARARRRRALRIAMMVKE